MHRRGPDEGLIPPRPGLRSAGPRAYRARPVRVDEPFAQAGQGKAPPVPRPCRHDELARCLADPKHLRILRDVALLTAPQRVGADESERQDSIAGPQQFGHPDTHLNGKVCRAETPASAAAAYRVNRTANLPMRPQ